MTRRTRVFLGVSIGVLVLGLGTGLVASYMGGFQNLVLIGSDGPEELALVPRDAQMVAYADVHSIMNSGVRKKVREMSPRDTTQENQFEAHTGINVETDVDHVVASSIASPEDNPRGMPLILARGRFNPVRIEGAMRDQGGAPQDYRGTHLVVHPSDPAVAVAFLEPGLVAVGPLDSVRRAVDMRATRSTSIRDNPDVMRQIKEVKDGNTWAVARFDAIAGRAPLPPDIAGRLPAITWFSASGNVDDGIHGTVRAEARDDAAAQDLREVIRGFMALARMQAGDKAEFSALINSLQLSGQGRNVTLAFSVPPEMIDVLASMRAQHGDPGHPPTASPAPRQLPQPRPRRGA